MPVEKNIEQMKQFISANPQYVSGDDDTTTEAGIRETAKMVHDRKSEDLAPVFQPWASPTCA